MKKGFTLLELLAVIILLAVIALIAMPVVINVVDEAKKSAFEDNSYGIIKAGELYYAEKLLDGGITSEVVFNFPDVSGLDLNGAKPKSGYMKVTVEGKVELAISDGKYCVKKSINDTKVSISEDLENCRMEQLDEPTIEIEGDRLYIVSGEKEASKYNIYVDGVLKTTINAANNVTTLPNSSDFGIDYVSGGEAYVGGTWIWNDIINPPSSGNIDENIVFKTSKFAGFIHDRFEVYSYESGEDIFINMRGYKDGKVETDMHDSSGWWHRNEKPIVMDFGDTLQPVSSEFYNYLTTNARKVNWNDYMVGIKGLWKWNDTLTEPPTEGIYIYTPVNAGGDSIGMISFVTTGSLYGGTVYRTSLDEEVGVYVNGYGWLDGSITYNQMMNGSTPVSSDIFQTWNFGTNYQEVEKVFYDYMKLNAKEVTVFNLDELNLSSTNHTVTVTSLSDGYEESNNSNIINYEDNDRTISGVWVFNDTITLPNTVISSGNVNFTIFTQPLFSNEFHTLNCSMMTVTKDKLNIFAENANPVFSEPYVYQLPLSGSYYVYSSSGWNIIIGEGIKTIDFGVEPQMVSEEFYNWFIENATLPVR